jgi:hypothetical protein
MYTNYYELDDEVITSDQNGNIDVFKNQKNIYEIIKKENLIEEMSNKKDKLSSEVKYLENINLKETEKRNFKKNLKNFIKDLKEVFILCPLIFSVFGILIIAISKNLNLSLLNYLYSIFVAFSIGIELDALIMGVGIINSAAIYINNNLFHKKEYEELNFEIKGKQNEIEYLNKRINEEEILLKQIKETTEAINKDKIYSLNQKEELEKLKEELNKQYDRGYNEQKKLLLIKK